MAKPWLERWVKDLELSGRVEAEGDLDTYVTDGYESDDRTQLISAAPDMCHDCGQPIVHPNARVMLVQVKKHSGEWSEPAAKWFCAPSCNKRVVRGETNGR